MGAYANAHRESKTVYQTYQAGDIIPARDVLRPDLWLKGRVCKTDFMVYSQLKWHGWHYGRAYPTRRHLLDAILSKLPPRLNGKPRLSIDGLDKAIRRLEKHGLIQLSGQGLKRLPNGKMGRVTIYRFLFHSWMVEPKPERFQARAKKSTTQNAEKYDSAAGKSTTLLNETFGLNKTV